MPRRVSSEVAWKVLRLLRKVEAEDAFGKACFTIVSSRRAYSAENAFPFMLRLTDNDSVAFERTGKALAFPLCFASVSFRADFLVFGWGNEDPEAWMDRDIICCAWRVLREEPAPAVRLLNRSCFAWYCMKV